MFDLNVKLAKEGSKFVSKTPQKDYPEGSKPITLGEFMNHPDVAYKSYSRWQSCNTGAEVERAYMRVQGKDTDFLILSSPKAASQLVGTKPDKSTMIVQSNTGQLWAKSMNEFTD